MSNFYETIFLKEDSSLESKLNTLRFQLDNKEEVHMLETGIAGEKQVAYHLSKSNIGMYVMRDVNFASDDLTAQVDFIAVTSHHCYFIECKNYNADIIHVDESCNFELSTKYKSKYKKIGIKSPISQVDDQLNVFKKICLNDQDKVKDLLSGVKFTDYFKTIVVFTNPENRLNIKNAPNSIKYRILKVDNLIRQIEYDGSHYKGTRLSQSQMNEIANYILDKNVVVQNPVVTPVFESVTTPPITVNQTSNVYYSNFNQNNYSQQITNKKQTDYSALIKLLIGPVGSIIGGLFLMIFGIAMLFAFYKYYSLRANPQLTIAPSETVNVFKQSYTNSTQNGFDVIDLDDCKKMSSLFKNQTFDCDKFPLEINIVNDHIITIFKNNSCFTLELSNDGNSILSTNRKPYSISSSHEDCKGVPVGVLEYDENNSFCQKIGGLNKIREIATFVYTNNSSIDSFIDYSHVEERGGSRFSNTVYYMNVSMYFSALTSKGYNLNSPSTNLKYTNSMCEDFYYIMK